jgi:hypothetical protein
MRISRLLFAVCVLTATSCKKAPEDPLCRYDPLPDTAGISADQGGIQITAASEDYFYVLDSAGKQVGSARTNQTAPVKPGDYKVTLNKSPHTVSVRAKTLTKCSAGDVLVSGGVDQYYYVLDSTGTQLASKKIGGGVALFPGTYRVQVNKTTADAEVKPGAVTELKPGIVTVQGGSDEYYYVFDSTGAQLASAKLAAPLALLPGAWTVKVNNTTAPVHVTAGVPTEVKAATLVVHGVSDEYYYVLDSVGKQLVSSKLNRPVSVIAGSYRVKVNNAKMDVKAEGGNTTECQTASLTVKGGGSDYYYVLDPSGTQLASSKLNQAMSLPEGSYQVKVGSNARPVKLVAGQPTIVNW